jgi:hypothetical protein
MGLGERLARRVAAATEEEEEEEEEEETRVTRSGCGCAGWG